MTFPIGYHSLHPDTSMNFQMNRWFGWVSEPGMLEEMQMAAPRIASYADWKREFLALAENAAGEGHILRVGFYFRAADFFMRPDDADRSHARERFLRAMRSVYGLDQIGRHEVPYAADGVKGTLPAYRFTPSRPKGTIVFFGGFDSYIEELTSPWFKPEWELGKQTAAASLGITLGSAAGGLLFNVAALPGAPFILAAGLVGLGLFLSFGLPRLLVFP